MSFVGSMVGAGGAQGAGFQAQGTNILQPSTVAEANQAAQTATGALGQQQAFTNAAAASNGLGNQSNVYGQLAGVAAGTGPNPAQAMLAQQTGQNAANQSAMMGSQRGASQNVGLMARQGAQQGANLQQQAVGQGATMQANQSLAALGQMGGIAGQQVAQQQGALGTLNSAAQGEQSNILGGIASQNQANVGMQSNINNANQAQAAVNTKNQAGLLGGISGAIGPIGSAISKALGPAAPVAALAVSKGGMIPSKENVRNYDLGTPQGTVAAPAVAPSPVSALAPQGDGMSAFERFHQSLGGNTSKITNPQGTAPPAQAATPAPPTGMDEVGSNIGKGLLAGVNALTGQNVQMKANGGNVDHLKQKGGGVPGRAKVKGDSLKNDTVSAKLSPGEVVIPRSVMNSSDPLGATHAFVAAILAKKGKSYGS